MTIQKGGHGRKRRLSGWIMVIIIVFAFFWFSDILPKKVAEWVATNHMLRLEEGSDYEVSGVDYSNAHDCYFVYFVNRSSSEQRHLGIYYRYFPFHVFYDSNYPG